MKKELVNIFKEIRDIPYGLRFNADEEDLSCDGKHKKLAEKLISAGYIVRKRTRFYRWRSLPIPENILKLDPSDLYLHSFLEVLIDGRWVRIDITWDKGLEKIFPINNWDGNSDTKIAVTCIGAIFPAEDPLVFQKTINKEKVNENLKKREKFHIAFNGWLNEIRGTK